MVISIIDKLILIAGKSNSGKGTVATLLNKELSQNENNNVIQCSLSTYIRQITKNDFYWNGINTPKSRMFMGEVYRLATELIYPYHMARRVLEHDILPNLNEDKFNIVLVESFREKVNYDYFKMVEDKYNIIDITTLNIIRPKYDVVGKKLKNHQSEADLDNFEFDYTILNNKNIDVLKSKVKMFVHDEFFKLYTWDEVFN